MYPYRNVNLQIHKFGLAPQDVFFEGAINNLQQSKHLEKACGQNKVTYIRAKPTITIRKTCSPVSETKVHLVID